MNERESGEKKLEELERAKGKNSPSHLHQASAGVAAVRDLELREKEEGERRRG